MALVLADRVQEYSTTTGTGDITLSGAYAGFQTFAAGIGNGNTCYYTITSDTNQWEVGIGTVGVGTLARTTLISSSTGAKVSFTGTLTVFVTYPAEKAVYGEGTAIVAPTGALLPIANGGTNATTAGAALTNLGAQPAFGSQTANTVYAAPSGSAGSPTFRALVATDVPTLNQNTTGTAANVTGIVAIANGGTGSSTASTARTALGLGTIATQDANNVAITGGAIDGATVGSTTVAAGSFSTLNSSGNTRLGGVAGNQSLQVNNVASAVNYVQAVGATTTNAPTISAQGSDAAISLAYTSKASGSHTFNTGGGQQFAVGHTASSVDYLQVSGNSNGYPSLSAQGASTNVSIVYGSKGTGGHNFTTNGLSVNQFVITNTASAVNYAQFTGATTGAPVTMLAQGSDANISLAYSPKGTGKHSFYSNSGTQFVVGNTASAVNYVQAIGATTTNAPELSAQGSDGTINLKLTPKGAGGTLQFGTYTAGVLTQAGYITITDAGGTSRRLLVG